MLFRTLKRATLGIIIAAMALLLAEATLRWTQPGLDEVVSPLLYQRNSGEVFTPGTTPNTRIYVSGRRRAAVNKAPGKRVLIVGASAAYGEMFTAFTAFPGQAERILRNAVPDVPIEFINLAHGGMGSRQVKEMVFRAISRDAPDLIIVYSGNNEYHELRALKARSARYDPGAELLRRRLSKRSFLYRKLRDLVEPSDTLTPPEDTEWLPIGRLDVRVSEDDRALGQLLYKEHLTEIALAAAEFNVPLMLTTVASNLRDHVDNQTPGDFPPTAQARLHSLAEMVDKVDRGSFLRAIDDAQPELQSEGAQFQLGQLLLRGGLRNAAFKAFEDAEMLALRPMSSDRQLRQTVRNVAQQHEVPLCDLAATLAASSADGSPGNDLFVDHCHPNAAGHHQLGVTLARCIVRDDLLKLGITDTVLETAIKHVETTTVDPFRLDHFTGHRPIPGMKTPSPPPADTALGSAQRGHLAFVASDFDGALRAYKRAESMGAPVPAILLNQGLTHLYLGDLAAARTAIDKAAESATENANINQLRRTLGD